MWRLGDVRAFPRGRAYDSATGGRTAGTSWCRRTFRGDVLMCVELTCRVFIWSSVGSWSRPLSLSATPSASDVAVTSVG